MKEIFLRMKLYLQLIVYRCVYVNDRGLVDCRVYCMNEMLIPRKMGEAGCDWNKGATHLDGGVNERFLFNISSGGEFKPKELYDETWWAPEGGRAV